MKFGLFYEHQLPQPRAVDSDLRLYQQALDQVELADRLGIDYIGEVEHHFLEESFGRKAPSAIVSADRGGAISVPTQDPVSGTA
jgi:hypothetical protein